MDRTRLTIFATALLFGAAFWVLDGVYEYYRFVDNLRFMLFQEPVSFADSLILNVPPHALLNRLAFLTACLIAGVLVDWFVRKRRESLEALREGQRWLEVALEGSALGMWSWNLETDHIDFDARCLQMLGYRRDEVGDTFARIKDLINPGDLPDVLAQMSDHFAGRSPSFECEGRMIASDGRWRWILARARVVERGPDGTPIRMAGSLLDITDRKEAQLQQARMMQELDHRVKNNLATVLALLTQTSATTDSIERFRETFTGRVKALARTHEALAATRWRGVEVRQAIELILGPYLRRNPKRVRRLGPPTMLPPEASKAICLALHELATNAAKYGALSAPDGRLELSWRCDDRGGITFDWQEHDGPPITDAAEPGVGLTLVRGMIEYELAGTVEIDFDPQGLRCRIELPGREDEQQDAAQSELEEPDRAAVA